MVYKVCRLWWLWWHENRPMPLGPFWWHGRSTWADGQNSLLRRISCHHATHATTFKDLLGNWGGDIQLVARQFAGFAGMVA